MRQSLVIDETTRPPKAFNWRGSIIPTTTVGKRGTVMRSQRAKERARDETPEAKQRRRRQTLTAAGMLIGLLNLAG